VKEHGLSIGGACRVTRLSRTAWYRRPRSCMERDRGVIEVLNEIVARKPRWASGSSTTGCGWMVSASTTSAYIGCTAQRYQAVLTHLGGEDNLTTIKRSLVRRFAWYKVMIEGIECRTAAGEPVDIGSWTQLTNSWLGIVRMLGLERRQRPVPHLNGTAKAVST
jgi:hypothetical protein